MGESARIKMSLHKIFERVQYHRERDMSVKNAPRRGPKLLIEAYQDQMPDCPYCKTHDKVKGYNPGRRGQIQGCYFYYECGNCGAKF